MIKKFALALSMTTFCVNVDSTYAVPKNQILDMDLSRGIRVKQKIRVEGRVERRIKTRIARKIRAEGGVERRINARIAGKTRAERLAERRKTINALRKARTERLAGRNIRLAQKKRTRFEPIIQRPTQRMRVLGLGIRTVTIAPRAVAPRKFHIRPLLVQILSVARKSAMIKKVEQEKSYEHFLSYGGGINNYKNLENQQDNVKKSLKIAEKYPEYLEGQIANDEILHVGVGLNKIIENPKPLEMFQHIHATPYLLGQDTPTPTDDEPPLKEGENVLFAQNTTPFIETTPFDGGTPTVNLSKKKGSWSSADGEDSSEGFSFSKKFKVYQSGSQPQSPSSTPGSNRVRVMGQNVGGSSSDEGISPGPKPKVPQLSLSSPNRVRVMGINIESGSSSTEDFFGPFGTKVERKKINLDTLPEESEDELTYAGLPGKLETLLNLGTMLKFPAESLERTNAAISFRKLRAKIDGLDEKALVAGDLAMELSALQKCIQVHTSKVQQDEVSFPKASPRTISLKKGLIRSANTWLDHLLRLNGIQSNK